MVLAYLKQPIDYDHLLQLLQIKSYGAPASNIRNDPYFSDAPLTVPKGDFELAWLARDYYYALITLSVGPTG